jgi:hypothetical protein
MRLSGFETHLSQIERWIPGLSRAPPQKKFQAFFDIHAKIPFLVAAEEPTPYESNTEISQTTLETEKDFDQRNGW